MTAQVKKLLITVTIFGIGGLVFFWTYPFEAEEGLKVSRPEGATKWPLTVNSGSIHCQWKELVPESNYRHAKRPMVLFESQPNSSRSRSRKSVYGVNGAAIGVGGYPSIKNIMVDKRFWPLGASSVVSEWIQAGLALCDGDGPKAREAIERAKTKATEPFPPGVNPVLSTDTETVDKRRIFLETVRCEDRAIEESFRGHWNVDELIFSGRRDEAIKLTRQRLKKEDEIMASCKSALREREGLSIEEHIQIVSEGLSRWWPTD